MMTTKTARTPGSPAEFPQAENAGPIWAALVDDTNSGVIVVDAEGQIVYANTSASGMCGKTNARAGAYLRDIWEEDLAKERIDLVREAAATGRIIALEGMVGGRWIRTVFRPMPPDNTGKRHVLMVCRAGTPTPKTEGDPNPPIRARVDDPGQLGSLTTREMEILKLIGAGLSTADIAKRLHRSVKTVEWHRVSLGNKLGVTNRVELARIAIGAGIVGLDEPGSSGAGAEGQD